MALSVSLLFYSLIPNSMLIIYADHVSVPIPPLVNSLSGKDLIILSAITLLLAVIAATILHFIRKRAWKTGE